MVCAGRTTKGLKEIVMTKDKFESEIKLLEDMANTVRYMPRESRDAIKHALKTGKADRKADDDPKPNFNVGGKAVVTSASDYFVPYVGKIVRLEEDSAYITVGCGRIKVPIDRLKPYTEPTAEEEDENKPKRDIDRFIEAHEKAILGKYHMELAAKIAVAYAEKGRYEPEEIGAKAVEVADGVVDALKNDKK